MSSIPVHLDYFLSHSGRHDHQEQSERYISALCLLTVASVVVLGALLAVIPLGLSAVLIVAICFTFVSEKLADETSRALEFRKEFGRWFLVQTLRSGWLFLPILSALVGAPYSLSFLLTSILFCAIMLVVFRLVLGLTPRVSWVGLPLIWDNVVFLVGSALPASYRQVPRIVVSRLFPNQAHVFLAVAQVCQGATLIYNVKFQVPYRKLIARRTQMFQRRLNRTVLRLILAISAVGVGYIAISVSGIGHQLYGLALAMVLVPVMVADALTFGIISTHLGFLPWFTRKNDALITYILCLGILSVPVAIFVGFGLMENVTVLNIPIMTISVGITSYFFIIRRHFAPGMLNG